MSRFLAALWAEQLKARRSVILGISALAGSMLPLSAGLFMVILKDPAAARQMGLISAKAQILAGSADAPAFLEMLLQGTAIVGAVLFAFVTAWVFGAEFANRTNTDLLALPTPRGAIVMAKFALVVAWTGLLVILLAVEGAAVGMLVDIPGWSTGLVAGSLVSLIWIWLLSCALMSPVAFLASAGRGYLPPMGWALFTLALAQLAAVLGWGGWFPWSVPALLSGAAGPPAEVLGAHSYLVVLITSLVGVVATLLWWQRADQSR